MAIPSQLRYIIGSQASFNYKLDEENISHVKAGVQLNRDGKIDLASITQDENRLDKRIQREIKSGTPRAFAIERINGVVNFQDTKVLQRLAQLSRTVCRICLVSDNMEAGYGTGFLIGNDLLITNNHVLPDVASAVSSYAEFNFELGENNKVRKTDSFNLLPNKFFMTSTYQAENGNSHSGLDFTIVALEPVNSKGAKLTDYGFTTLDSGVGKIIDGENCVVIQHPEGKVKKVVLKDTRMLTVADNTLVYESDTLPGSSGSMVIGLGTGELVALHHSGIPRTDDQGNWLRKDGTIAGPDDRDDQIDWIGNEGIRISRIVKAVIEMQLNAEMNEIRLQLIKLHEGIINNGSTEIPMQNSMNIKKESDTSKVTDTKYFEIFLTDDPRYKQDLVQRSAALIPGCIKCEALFPSSSDPNSSRLYYLTVKSDRPAWELAAEIEGLPHVLSCTPDIPIMTDVGIEEHQKPSAATKSAVEGLFKSKTEEQKFLEDWGNSYWVTRAHKINPEYHRQWNWVAITHPYISAPFDPLIVANLNKLRYVQLDTGFSEHPKIFSSYNLDQDMDFIDGVDGVDDDGAVDSMSRGLFKHPAHGTRTASITLGVQDPLIKLDGNLGILTDSLPKPTAKLIPYRISKSVILINRGIEMVAAANHAIRSGTDVMFMCMGSIPKQMFDVVAREAYEQGVIWVCAAGNQVRFVIAPACYPGTIAVAAINPNNEEWTGSCRGETVDISAPGEDCYVPNKKNGKYCMNYGSGTSYATPHIASAAMMWKAKHRDKLASTYEYKWQIVEAFRDILKKTATKNTNLPTGEFGAGVLNLDELLKKELPPKEDLKHAYLNKEQLIIKPVGEREMAHTIWNEAIASGFSTEKTGVEITQKMSPKAREAYIALKGSARKNKLEAEMTEKHSDPISLLESYFKPY